MIITNVITRITAGESILRIGAGIPIGSRVKTLVGGGFAMNLMVVRKFLVGGMMPNDLLPIWL